MTAAVAPLPQQLRMPESSAEARKRRREILASQRLLTPDAAISSLEDVTHVADMPSKRRKVTDDSSFDGKPSKKPQMKYDPDEPMSKEEAAAWRREQRRKRNRESAAASRQRQRDRICELEIELEEWKNKFDDVMKRIGQLEEIAAKRNETKKDEKKSSSPEQSHPQPHVVELQSKLVSPPSSPGHSPLSTPLASPVTSTSIIGTVKAIPQVGTVNRIAEDEEQQQHSDKMSSRLAVS